MKKVFRAVPGSIIFGLYSETCTKGQLVGRIVANGHSRADIATVVCF